MMTLIWSAMILLFSYMAAKITFGGYGWYL